MTVADRRLDPVALRRRAAATAGHTGDVAGARALVGDEEPKVRATALAALHRLDALAPAELLAALEDPDAAVRRRACEVATTFAGATGEPPDPEIAVAVAALLDDADPTVAEVAAWATGERPPAEGSVVARLARIATSHDDALCREAAVAALGALGDPAGLPAILTATADKATVRRRAVIALAPFEGREVDEALERARTDRDWQVRQAAEDLLTP
ncbi:MAG TPA: HEAT repeat domain-containing protein [Acidimicrobiales bacterium]